MAVIVHGRMKITLELNSLETVPDLESGAEAPNDDDSKDDRQESDTQGRNKGVKRKECENSAADDSSHDSDAFASSLPSLPESEPAPGQIRDGCDTCVLIGTCRKCGRAFRAYPVPHAI